MPNWYDSSFLLLHYDRNYTPSDEPAPGTGFDRDQLVRVLKSVRPDAVLYYAKGQSGYVPYLTRFSNQLPISSYDEQREDVLRAFREVTQELGIRFVVGVSGLIDGLAAAWHPGWQRVGSDFMPYPNRALCPNTPYVGEWLLPQLEEILEEYRPDGLWIDSDNWTVSPCYCSSCETEFQMLHERSAPHERMDPAWEDWLAFHRTSFQAYVEKVARYLHDRDTGLVYATNSGYGMHQAEPVAVSVDRLTRDLSPAYSLNQASLEARFFDRRGVPFDLITWNQASARPWPQGRLNALPAYPKTFDHLAQEGATILANGGRWTVWLTPYSSDALPERQHAEVAEAARFARERQPWCSGSESAAYVAVLHSDLTHRRVGNGMYDPGPSLDRIRGAHQALLELHHPHDVVNEQTLLRDLGRYSVIVLPEQTAIPHDLDEPLVEWVRQGGRLIASGRVSPRINEDIPTFAVEEALGVRWTGGQEAFGYFLHRESAMRVAASAYRVSLEGAETFVPFLRSGNPRDGELDYPAVTRHTFGAGEAYYVAADFFAAYHRCQYPGFREVLRQILDRALPHPPLITTAPPTIEITLRMQPGRTLLHFVNHAPGKSLAQNSAFIEAVPPAPTFSVTLALPERPAEVHLQPEGIEPEWSFENGTLTAFIPPVHLHGVLVLSSSHSSPSIE